MQTIKRFSLLLILILPTSALASDQAQAVDLLNRMNDAQQQLEYSGELVFLKNGEMSHLSIEQKIENGIRKETVIPLDYYTKHPTEKTSTLSLNSSTAITSEMQDIYSFDLGEKSRVAGRDCQIIIARPKDRKRYLQRYCVDIEKNILLEYSLTNLEHQPIERFKFTNFKIADQQPNPTQLPQTISLASNQQATKPISENSKRSQWIFDPLPAGFKMVIPNVASTSQNNSPQEEHIIITDGLSSVSVFIAKNIDDQVDSTNPAMKSGSLNILTQIKDKYTVTLVGEVPRRTLQDIYASLRSAY